MRAVVFAALLFAGCQRCGAPSGPDAAAVVDAGFRLPAPARSVDLRTAIIAIYPEYRGTAMLDARATLTRTVSGLTDARRDAFLSALHWAPAEDGGWAFSTFHLSQPSPQELALTVSYDTDHLAHLYVAAAGLTTMELGLYLPRDVPVVAETFRFDVEYASSPERSRELVRQAVQLLLGNAQWTAAGPGPQWADGSEVDAGERHELAGPQGARVTFERKGGRVHARYALTTR